MQGNDSAGPIPVVLLHGLARSPRSMARLARTLAASGHAVSNLGYPSRRLGIADCAARLRPEVDALRRRSGRRIAFVTHSMGGLVARHLASADPGLVAGIVMLGPPNRGSEAADVLSRHRLGRAFYGPAIHDLRTDRCGEQPDPGCPVRVIAGTRVLIPFFVRLIPGSHDGLVSLDRSRLDAMESWHVVAGDHTFLMHHPEAIRHVHGALATWGGGRAPQGTGAPASSAKMSAQASCIPAA